MRCGLRKVLVQIGNLGALGRDPSHDTRKPNIATEQSAVFRARKRHYRLPGQFDAGCDGYIAKPIDTRSLPDQVARLLELKVRS